MVIAHRMTFFIAFVLGENAARIRRAGFGAAIGLFAGAPHQFLLAHGHPGAIPADVHDGHGAAAGLSPPFLPLLRRLSHPPHCPLDWARTDLDAAGFQQMVLGLLATGCAGSLQAHQPSQRRRVAHLQTQRRIGRAVPRLFAFMVVVVPLQFEATKQAIDLEAFPSLAWLARLGLAGAIDPIGGPLQQPAHQRVGRLEDRGAHQRFQLLDGHPVGRRRLEARQQLLDFPVLGQEDFRRAVFFLGSKRVVRASRRSPIGHAGQSVPGTWPGPPRLRAAAALAPVECSGCNSCPAPSTAA